VALLPAPSDERSVELPTYPENNAATWFEARPWDTFFDNATARIVLSSTWRHAAYHTTTHWTENTTNIVTYYDPYFTPAQFVGGVRFMPASAIRDFNWRDSGHRINVDFVYERERKARQFGESLNGPMRYYNGLALGYELPCLVQPVYEIEGRSFARMQNPARAHQVINVAPRSATLRRPASLVFFEDPVTVYNALPRVFFSEYVGTVGDGDLVTNYFALDLFDPELAGLLILPRDRNTFKDTDGDPTKPSNILEPNTRIFVDYDKRLLVSQPLQSAKDYV
jgi:hypothetical protein